MSADIIIEEKAKAVKIEKVNVITFISCKSEDESISNYRYCEDFRLTEEFLNKIKTEPTDESTSMPLDLEFVNVNSSDFETIVKIENVSLNHSASSIKEETNIVSESEQTLETSSVASAPFACKICEKRFTKPSSLFHHNRVVHNLHETSCYFCDFLPKSQSQLKNHIDEEHADKKSWTCKDCGKTFFELRHLKTHFLIHKGNHTCSVCGHKVSSKSKMVEHMRRHTGEKAFSCSKCDRKFKQPSSLKRHMTTYECDKLGNSEKTLDTFDCKENGSKNHECKVCNYNCTTKFTLTNHMRKHTEEKPFQCYDCDKAFKQKRALKIHLTDRNCKFSINKVYGADHKNSKTAIIKYTASVASRIYGCKVCDKKFTKRSGLRSHNKIVHNIIEMSCFFCDCVPHSTGELRKHLEKEHADKKTITCEHCDKTFFEIGDLKCHMTVHNTKEKHVCEICGCKFAMASCLTEHMTVHTGEKPFKCFLCDRSFRLRAGLTKHMGTTHSNLAK